MVGQVNNPAMQYAHLGLSDQRRDSSMDNGSANFQSHVPSLNQALGHSHAHINTAFSRPHDYPISPSPPVHPQQNGQASMAYNGLPSNQVKRKHIVENAIGQVTSKRRRDAEDAEGYDELAGGAKHWTDEEKTRLFKWLMAPGQDEHWNALRATKNSCLRDCAHEVFHGKKTYQALKGCYERNFNLFKQIYSFETFHGQTGSLGLGSNVGETDTLREYERRLQSARKAGCDVGNITSRTIDQWHRNGWYELFHRRWHGDPATTRPANSRVIHSVNGNGAGNDDADDADDNGLDFSDTLPPPPNSAGMSSHDRSSTAMPMSFMHTNMQHVPPPISPQTNGHNLSTQPSHTSPTISSSTTSPPSSSLANSLGSSSLPSSSSLLTSSFNPLAPLNSANHTSSPASSFSTASTLSSSNGTSSTLTASSPAIPSSTSLSSSSALAIPSSSDQGVVNLTLTQAMITSYLQFLQVQTQTSKMKLEYMRKREEREERDSHQRREFEKLKLDRERAEFEHKQSSANTKQKADKAIELLANPTVDGSVKQAAADFLKRLFASD